MLYRHMEHLLGLVFVSLIMLIYYPQSLTNVVIFRSGKFEFGQGKVREMSGNFAFRILWEPCLSLQMFYRV